MHSKDFCFIDYINCVNKDNKHLSTLIGFGKSLVNCHTGNFLSPTFGFLSKKYMVPI